MGSCDTWSLAWKKPAGPFPRGVPAAFSAGSEGPEAGQGMAAALHRHVTHEVTEGPMCKRTPHLV